MNTRKTKAEKEADALKTQVAELGVQPATDKSLIEQAQAESPHKDGWNKEAARALAAEFATSTQDMSVREMMVLANLYKNFAGWGNLMDALAVLHCGKKLKS